MYEVRVGDRVSLTSGCHGGGIGAGGRCGRITAMEGTGAVDIVKEYMDRIADKEKQRETLKQIDPQAVDQAILELYLERVEFSLTCIALVLLQEKHDVSAFEDVLEGFDGRMKVLQDIRHRVWKERSPGESA